MNRVNSSIIHFDNKNSQSNFNKFVPSFEINKYIITEQKINSRCYFPYMGFLYVDVGALNNGLVACRKKGKNMIKLLTLNVDLIKY